jgi:outer membrane immunogenic protein
MMKPTLTAIAVLAFACPTHAGGPTLVDTDPVPAAMPAPAGVDWSGPYAGLSYGRTSGYMDMEGFGLFDYEDGRATGGFLGYNLQRGKLVYGGELSYASVSGMVFSDTSLGGDDTVDSLLELRGRVGYSLGNALIYGAFGLAKGNYTLNASGTPTASGTSLGIGMDYLMTDQIFVGLDYTRRTMDGANDDPTNPFNFDAPVDSVSLRVGLSF